MMLVERDGIKTQLFGIAVFVQIIIVIVGRLLAVKQGVGHGEVGFVLEDFVFVEAAIGPFGEI